MTTKVIATDFTTYYNMANLPVTPRGRALYTVDWFANGKPVLRHHDIAQTRVRQVQQP